MHCILHRHTVHVTMQCILKCTALHCIWQCIAYCKDILCMLQCILKCTAVHCIWQCIASRVAAGSSNERSVHIGGASRHSALHQCCTSASATNDGHRPLHCNTVHCNAYCTCCIYFICCICCTELDREPSLHVHCSTALPDDGFWPLHYC